MFSIDGLLYLEGLKFNEINNKQLRTRLGDEKLQDKLKKMKLVSNSS